MSALHPTATRTATRPPAFPGLAAPRPARRNAPPRVGIIGTGWGVWVQLPAWRAAGLEVVALAGAQREKTRQIAAAQGIPFATGDWQELLARAEVALVSIVTPPHLHAPMARAALAAGKHVLCEKPLGLDSAEVRELVEVASRHPRQLALVDHELRFLPAVREARRLIAAGAIGQPRHARLCFAASAQRDPRQPWGWWHDATRGGGALGAAGAHQIDLLRYLLADEVVAAQGQLRTVVAARPVAGGGAGEVTADDVATFRLRLCRGGEAAVTATMAAPRDTGQQFTLVGDAGTLRLAGGRLHYARPGAGWRDVTPPHTLAERLTCYPDYAEATSYLGQALRAALMGDPAALAPAATFADGLRIQQVLDAVRRSNASGGWVAL